MNHRGFTITELIIIITAMGILMTLAVVNLSSSQANSRDTERKTDVESIALYLDTFYNSGSDNSSTLGRYPSTVVTQDLETTKLMLRDIDTKVITAPNETDSTVTFKPATNQLQTTTTVTPQPEINQYIYQPIKSDGTLCTSETQDCRKFNIYYKLEVANVSDSCPSPGYVCMITSKNQ